ncbi:unnamed protein product [Clavelina lepadiformis]|uniref:Insulin-like growth factor-binding protein 7 n=1 Tax=Clavelina lepadiformis TaxID=159417 RepID=A0ABP0GC41_CLALP
MKLVICVVFMLLGLSHSQSPDECSCPESCPEISCPAELRVRDRCDCCETCLGVEGSVCSEEIGRFCALSDHKYGFSCVMDPTGKDRYGECHCKHPKKGPFCGQDGVTYKTKCDLQVASWMRVKRNSSKVDVAYHGECEELPILTRRPGNVNNRTGEKVYLACEAYGIPTPHITFRKITQLEDESEMFEEMPSDRLNMAVQIRGGPDKHKISAWVLVDPLMNEDAGLYECLASNTQGSVSDKGYINIIH